MVVKDFRLKFRHFLKKYKRIIITILVVWGLIIFINKMILKNEENPEITSTYEPHISVMSQLNKTPKKMQVSIENLIEEYVNCCNNQNYEKAFNLLSEDCRKYNFNDNPVEFVEYVLTKMPAPRKYAIQNYSNFSLDNSKIYIYEIKYFEDLLATGLTGKDFYYTSEKIAFSKDEAGNVKMSVGGYIYQKPIQSISENEYLKIDVISKVVDYSTEKYSVKFTNRSENIIVIADGYENEEILLQLAKEAREGNGQVEIVLNPGESIAKTLSFQKYIDDGDNSLSLIFNNIRVMEVYSGINDISKEIIDKELNEAIAKFSMNVPVAE